MAVAEDGVLWSWMLADGVGVGSPPGSVGGGTEIGSRIRSAVGGR